MRDSNDRVFVPSAINRKVLVLAGLVILGSVLSLRVNASPDTYRGSVEYNSTSGYRGWTYWDSLGQQMVWNVANSRWTCLNALTPWCYWTSTGGHPGIDRNVLRRWTPPGAGSARITGLIQKDSNFCDEQNVAIGKNSTQSSVGWGGVPSRGNDGNTNGDFWAGSVIHTDYNAQAWYQIDLGASYLIHRIEVWNRSDGSSGESARMTNFNVMSSADGLNWTTVKVPGQGGFPTSLPWWSYGRYVKVQLAGTNYLHLAEVKVFSNANDGVYARIWHETAQSNYYLTYTTPGPNQRTAHSWYMGCADSNAYPYDIDEEIYPGDKIEFEISRNSNYNWDGTTFNPTIVFEPADAIGNPWTTTTATSVEVRFNGFLKCPNGGNCNYTDTLPPDYYTVHRMGTVTGGSVFLGQLPNWARCGPADGPFCLNAVRPSNFSVLDSSGISPNSSYKYKIRAYRGGAYPNGRLYGQTRTIQTTTGAITPPALTPTVSVTAASSAYGARDAVISWQAPASPLDKPAAMERLELYRQGLGSAPSTTVAANGSSTGSQLCTTLNNANQTWSCIFTTASGGSCTVALPTGSASCAIWDPAVMIGFSKWDNNNVMQMWVDTAKQASPTRRTDLSTAVVTSVTDPGVDRKPTTYRYFLVARYKPAYASPTERSEVTSRFILPRASTIAGFADTHVHQFGNLGHGGTLLDGRSGDADDGTVTYNGNPVDLGGFSANATGLALRGCDATSGGGTGNHDFGLLGNIVLDFAGFGHDKSGIKNMPQWLHHGNSLHQQVYKSWLKRAVDGGLRLIVMNAVNSEFVCKVAAFVRSSAGLSPAAPISCTDSTALEAQIDAAYRLQSEIDLEYCPGSPIPTVGLPNTHLSNEAPDYECGWYRIVTDPAAARKVMSRGKLAVVLGIESATPFNCDTGVTGPWGGGSPSKWDNVSGPRGTCMIGGGPVSGVIDILDPMDGMSMQYFYNKGVRHVFPIHGINNGLGSTAISTASTKYAFNEAALHGEYFRTGACPSRPPGSSVDPLSFRLSLPLSSTTVAMPLGLGTLSFTNVVNIPLPPGGYPGGTGATCNIGGPLSSTAPPFGLTPLGRSVIQEMMKRRMMIDIDHMSELSHMDTVAESMKSFNYPLVSGHTNLQRLSIGVAGAAPSEVALSTPELNEVRLSGGQVNLVALGVFKAAGVATHTRLSGSAAAAQFLPRVASVANDCDDSDKVWAQQYLAAIDLTRSAPVPNDNSQAPVNGVGFGSDINTINVMLQPRFGSFNGNYSGCSLGGGPPSPETGLTPQQEAQWNANVAGGIGKAVQYNVDMISGAATTKGFGGIETALPADVSNNFPGFNGPRLRRSRLNEGGYLFTLYGPDKAVDGAPGGRVPTMCLDSWNSYNNGDWPRIGGCGNTRNLGQQWHYDGAPSLRIRPVSQPSKNLVVQLPLQAVNSNGDYSVVMADSNVFADYSNPPPEAQWTQWASGQLYNALSGRCLSVENSGYGHGSRVVVAACTAGNTSLALRPDQLWARGGEEESFNLTGLHHIGMYPDLIQDLKNIGLTNKDLIPLFQSAEGYLQAWERTGWTKAVDYTKLSSDGTWKHATTTPPAGWQNVTFDDTAWRVVKDDSTLLAAYGAAPWSTSVSGFPRPTPARWMPIADGTHTHFFRKTFASDRIGTLKTVTVSGDDVVNVYLDGVLKASSTNWQVPATFTFTPSSFGSHAIAIEATNQGGPGGVLVDVR